MEDKITKEELIKSIKDTNSMAQASDKLGMAFTTFKRYAEKFELYTPNQSGRGIPKVKKRLVDVFNGKKHMVTSHLRIRLIREGFKKNRCEECNINEWNGNPISLELDHISGNRLDNSLENLRILCPNCHSQTNTFRGKNKK
jgi:Zn finger protein HypA/HybF involved in hydrogenase expression